MNDTSLVSSGNVSSNASALPPFDNIWATVGYVELMYFILGTPLNLLVAYICCHLIKDQKNQCIVLSMTVADTIFTIFHCLLWYMHNTLEVKTAGSCIIMYYATYIGSIASSLNLLLLNIDKFFLINRPLHHSLIITRSRIWSGIAVIWFISICWSSLILWGPATKYDPPCTFSPVDGTLYLMFLIIFYTLPITLSLSTSFYIAAIVLRTQRQNSIRKQQRQTGVTASVTAGYVLTGGMPGGASTITGSRSCSGDNQQKQRGAAGAKRRPANHAKSTKNGTLSALPTGANDRLIDSERVCCSATPGAVDIAAPLAPSTHPDPTDPARHRIEAEGSRYVEDGSASASPRSTPNLATIGRNLSTSASTKLQRLRSKRFLGTTTSLTSSCKRSASARGVRSILFVFCSTIWTGLTSLPYRIFYLVVISQGNAAIATSYPNLPQTLFLLMALNPIGNSLVTILTQRRYVNYIKYMLSHGISYRGGGAGGGWAGPGGPGTGNASGLFGRISAQPGGVMGGESERDPSAASSLMIRRTRSQTAAAGSYQHHMLTHHQTATTTKAGAAAPFDLHLQRKNTAESPKAGAPNHHHHHQLHPSASEAFAPHNKTTSLATPLIRVDGRTGHPKTAVQTVQSKPDHAHLSHHNRTSSFVQRFYEATTQAHKNSVHHSCGHIKC